MNESGSPTNDDASILTDGGGDILSGLLANDDDLILADDDGDILTYE